MVGHAHQMTAPELLFSHREANETLVLISGDAGHRSDRRALVSNPDRAPSAYGSLLEGKSKAAIQVPPTYRVKEPPKPNRDMDARRSEHFHQWTWLTDAFHIKTKSLWIRKSIPLFGICIER